MSLGSLLLKFQQTYGHGLLTAHYRDRVRDRILNTVPVTRTDDLTCEIHVLTCAADWLNLIWVLKSFYYYSGSRYALCIHDDGSLSEEHQGILKHHFPSARMVFKPAADARMTQHLAYYPRCLEFRQTNHLSPKLFDFAAYLESDRMLLLDSDVLFFAEPTALLQRIEDPDYELNSVNQDVASAYTVDPEIVKERFEFELCPRFNSGLGLIHGQSLNIDWIEEFLSLPDIIGHFWRIEQTLFALCSSRFGVELLPAEYTVRLDRGSKGLPSRHYVGPVRHLMYREGIRRLIHQGFLKELSV